MFYGEDVNEEQAQKAADLITAACPNAEVSLAARRTACVLLYDLCRVKRKTKFVPPPEQGRGRCSIRRRRGREKDEKMDGGCAAAGA